MIKILLFLLTISVVLSSCTLSRSTDLITGTGGIPATPVVDTIVPSIPTATVTSIPATQSLGSDSEMNNTDSIPVSPTSDVVTPINSQINIKNTLPESE